MNRPLPGRTSAERLFVGEAFLVAGMHRSGTSALTRVLSELGAELPRTLMAPGDDNPKGFWESIPLAALNDELLRRLDSAWDDPLSFIVRRDALSARPDVLSAVSDAIASEFSLSGPIVVKDPRCALLLDVWMAALSLQGYEPRVIIPVRDPLEVSASLSARNGFSSGRALLLWLSYVLSAEKASRSARRAFVQYSDLLSDWRGALRRTEQKLDVQFASWTPEAEIRIDAFLSAKDKHQNAPPELWRVRADVVEWVRQAYEWLLAAATSDAEPPQARLDGVAEEFSASMRVFAPVISEQRATLRSLGAKIEEHGRGLAEQGRRLTESAQRIDQLSAELKDRDAAAAERERLLAEAQGGVDRLAAEAAHQREVLSANAARAAELSAELEQRDQKLTRQNKLLADSAARIEALAADVRDRDNKLVQQHAMLVEDAGRIEAMEAEISERDTKLSAMAGELIATLNTESRVREDKAEQRALLENAARRLEALLKERQHALARVAALEADLAGARAQGAEAEASARARIADLEASLSAHEAALEQAEDSLAEARAHARAFEEAAREREAGLSRALLEHENTISRLRAEHEEQKGRAEDEAAALRTQVEAMHREIADRDAARIELVMDLGERDAVIARQASEVRARDGRLKEQDGALRSIRREVSARDIRIATLEHEIVAQSARATGAANELERVQALKQEAEARLEAQAVAHAAAIAELNAAHRAQAAAQGEALAESAARLEALRAASREDALGRREQLDKVGRAVAAKASELNASRRGEAAERMAQFAGHAKPRRRFAKLLRAPAVQPLLRSSWAGRALTLLGSGLYVPVDGPGGREIIRYARSERGARAPHPGFDEAWYKRARSPAIKAAAVDFLVHGDGEGANPNPLFDTVWYREQYRAHLSGWELTALEHYLLHGAAKGFNPHPLFDTAFYVSQAPEVYRNGVNPLAHYLREGWRRRLSPHPLFDGDWYLECHRDVAEAGIPGLVHFVTTGGLEGRDPHPLFGARFYLESNPDVRARGINPLTHYLGTGWREGRRPSPDFDPVAYLQANLEVARQGVEPLSHYVATGGASHEGLAEAFDAGFAAAMAPAEVLAGMTPLEAWVRKGRPTRAPIDSELATSSSLAPARHDNGALFEVLARGGELGDTYDWEAYVRLSSASRLAARKQIETLAVEPARLVDLDGASLGAAARSLRFEAPSRPRASIIIPVYNQIKYTLECLLSLKATLGEEDVEIIVIDDGSHDETRALVGAIHGVRYLRNEHNLGYLRTVNKAAKAARGDVLVILNNDTQVDAGWLAPLLAALDDPSIGVAAPKMLFPNGRLQEAGAKLKADGSADMIGLFDDPELPRFCYDRDVDYVSGACIAIRRGDFEALAGFDERYAPAYCEDSDLCLRVREMGLRIRYVAKSRIYHHLSVSSNALPGSYKMRQARRNQQKLVERWSEQIDALNQVRVVAFYLPQYHRIPENDRWWGPGFTEWRNVTRALPNYAEHYQPHRPAELGYYDLSNPGVMDQQAQLARDHGVHAFCYYYYWFSGRRVLEAPLERLVQTGKPDLPFCLCWANENWTRTWDGEHANVLLKQNYTEGDDEAIIADMIPFLRMRNYLRVNGKPLLVVYRPQLFPDPKRTSETWRRACRAAGVGEIYLAMVEVFEHALTYPSPKDFGFDASIEFPPSGMSAPMEVKHKLNPRFTGTVCDYNEVVRRYMAEPMPAHTRFRGAMPSWDNTARRQDVSYVFQGASPGAFQAWLEFLIEQTKLQNFGDERLVFVNAWNEWAEGAHLEPDLRFGRGWLEAVKNALQAGSLLSRGAAR